MDDGFKEVPVGDEGWMGEGYWMGIPPEIPKDVLADIILEDIDPIISVHDKSKDTKLEQKIEKIYAAHASLEASMVDLEQMSEELEM